MRTKIFIDYAMHIYKVDPSRIYLMGYSMGSGLTWDYAFNYPNQLAAVVPMSGSYSTGAGCMLKSTPAWAFQAADDTVGPPINQVLTVQAINNCNPRERAKLTMFPKGGHGEDEEFLTINLTGLGTGLPQYDVYDQNIYDWLLAHRRAITVTPGMIVMGETAELRWSVEGVEACLALGDWQGPRTVLGSEVVRPAAPGSYHYALSCGAKTEAVSLTVEAESARVEPMSRKPEE